MFNEFNKKIIKELLDATKYNWMLKNLFNVLEQKYSLPNRKEFIKNITLDSNRTKEEIFCELIAYILDKFSSKLKASELILANIYEVLDNINGKIPIINASMNITYPIGVLLQDNKSYISIIDNLYFKKIFPVHHEYFDKSTPTNLAVPEMFDIDIMQTYNSNYDEIYNNFNKKNTPLDIKFQKNPPKVDHKKLKEDLNTIFNLNLDHNNKNPIKITYLNFIYELSCIDNTNNTVECDDAEAVFDNKNKYIVKNKMITFRNIKKIVNSFDNALIDITGKCSENSVEIIGICINLLSKFK
jgi:hypothetical protein